MCALWYTLKEALNSCFHSRDCQSVFLKSRRSKSAAGTAGGVLLASGVFCKKEYKRFLERSSALSFRVPARLPCTRIEMEASEEVSFSLQVLVLSTPTTAELSHLHSTVLPLQPHSQIVVATTMGRSSLNMMENSGMVSGHARWNQTQLQ